MKGDFTRSTWDPKKRHASVRMQQGRVQIDADWNEQAEILEHLREAGVTDVVGPCGAPESGGGFAIGIFDTGDDLTVSPGRIYVDGILCELDEGATFRGQPVSYRNQPDYPDAPLPQAFAEPPEPLAGTYLVYLDVWRRHVTALEVPEIRERALGGPDTATRTRTLAQVKLLPATDFDGEVSCASSLPAWVDATAPGSGRLRARVQPGEADEGPCIVPADAGYTRLENQLYRVEVHDSGALGEATFKWSRDNGAVATAWLGQDETDSNRLLVASTGPDKLTGFHGVSWVELTDDDHELRGEPGILVRVVKVDAESIEIDPGGATIDHSAAGPHPKVRRWDLPDEAGGALTIEQAGGNQGYLKLESGIEVRFEAGTYRAGDYWQIPARAFVGELAGEIEWPEESPGQGEARPPAGIRHHHCRLALVEFDGTSFTGEPTDCRPRFPALTDLVDLSYVGGTGQSALPGRELPCPLRVKVSNGEWPVAGARVEFRLQAGGGALQGPAGEAVTAPASGSVGLILTSDERGVVDCRWRLPMVPPMGPDGRRCLTVVALLLDDSPVDDSYRRVFFTAEVAVASEVAYDPADCPPLAEAGADTVQRAIDELCQRMGVRQPGIGISEVQLLDDGRRLEFEDDLEAVRLAGGLVIECDQPIAPEAFAVPDRDAPAPARPNCTVSLDLPYPLGGENVWDISEGSVGYRELTLDATVVVEGNRILWGPGKNAQEFLRESLFRVLNDPERRITNRVLVHLRLKGNFIWLEGSGRRPEVYLDGEIFGLPADGDRIAGRFPTGNGISGGDFEMWFWVTPRPTDSPGLTITASAIGRRVRGQVTDGTNGIPGVVVTMVHAQTGASLVATTDATGSFQFNRASSGLQRLSVTFGGQTAQTEVTVPFTTATISTTGTLVVTTGTRRVTTGLSTATLAGTGAIVFGTVGPIFDAQPGAPATEVRGIGSVLGGRLAEAGVGTVGELAAAEPAAVAAALGVSEERAGEFIAAAREMLQAGAGRSVAEVSGVGAVLEARLAEGGIADLGQLAAAEPARVAEILGVSEVRAMGLVEAARSLLEE